MEKTKEVLDNQQKLQPSDLYNAYTSVLSTVRDYAQRNNITEIIHALVAVDFEFKKELSWYVNTHDKQIILPASNSFQKQMAADILGAVYCIAPCYRQENFMENDPLHLNFFYQIEVEVKGDTMLDAQNKATEILKEIERQFPSKLHKGTTNIFSQFETIDLAKMQNPPLSKEQFNEWSNQVSKTSEKPTWILHTPQTRRPRLNEDLPNTPLSLGFDLILPYGYGEVISGGERDKKETIDFFGKKTAYQFSSIKSSGFGIGLERLIRFLLGAKSVNDVLLIHTRTTL